MKKTLKRKDVSAWTVDVGAGNLLSNYLKKIMSALLTMLTPEIFLENKNYSVYIYFFVLLYEHVWMNFSEQRLIGTDFTEILLTPAQKFYHKIQHFAKLGAIVLSAIKKGKS